MTVPVTVYLQVHDREPVPVATVKLTSPEAVTGQLAHTLVELAQMVEQVMPADLQG